MNDFDLKYKPFGPQSILIEWPSEINESILNDVLNYKDRLKNYYNKQKVKVNHAYNSILITYDTTIDNIYDTLSEVKSCYSEQKTEELRNSTHYKIPVCYDGEYAVDLDFLATEKNLSKEEIIRLHIEPIYRVFFTGFLPGFLYLGGLDKRLFQSRRSEPRIRIPKGSVAIGGEQTGIYPSQSPGGWHLIGRTPIELFNPKSEPPCLVLAGDTLSFHSVSISEYKDLQIQVEKGCYKIESEVGHD